MGSLGYTSSFSGGEEREGSLGYTSRDPGLGLLPGHGVEPSPSTPACLAPPPVRHPKYQPMPPPPLCYCLPPVRHPEYQPCKPMPPPPPSATACPPSGILNELLPNTCAKCWYLSRGFVTFVLVAGVLLPLVLQVRAKSPPPGMLLPLVVPPLHLLSCYCHATAPPSIHSCYTAPCYGPAMTLLWPCCCLPPTPSTCW